MPPTLETEAEQMVFLPLPESWDVHLAQNHARTLDPEGGTESRKDCPRKESMKITGSGSSHPGGLLAFPFTGCQHWARRFTFLFPHLQNELHRQSIWLLSGLGKGSVKAGSLLLSDVEPAGAC